MKTFALIAIRNLLRHPRRSLVTILAVAFGLMALIFLRAFIYGVQTQITENIAHTLTGDLQIAPPSTHTLFAGNIVIKDPQRIRDILAATPTIQSYAERVNASGVVASAANTIVTTIVGVHPEQEARIQSNRPIVSGAALVDKDMHGVVIGEPMRKILEVDIGEKVVVTAQDAKGELSGEAFTLVGTFETGNDMIDNTTVMMLLPSAQRLMGIGDKISRFVIMLTPQTSVDATARSLQQKLSDNPQKLDVLTWREIAPMFASLMQFQNAMTFIVVLIVLTVVAAGTLNTLMMALIERTRELGLMLALGTTPRQVMLMVGLESLWLTGIGALLGSVLGIVVTFFIGQNGIDLSSFIHTAANFMVGSNVTPRIDWPYLLTFVLFIISANTLVSLYPAWRAGHLAPLESMRRAA